MNDVSTRMIRANGLDFAIDEAGGQAGGYEAGGCEEGGCHARGGDAVALCLHGFPESRFSWRHQLPALAAQGWRAVAPDMRGYGDTTRPLGVEAYRMDRLVEDVAALFDALGARRRLLVAHDWGALIAWEFAIRRTRPLDGLVIMNVPHPAVFRRVLASSPRQWLRSWYVVFFQLPWLPEVALTASGARAIGQAFRGMAVDKSRFPPDVLGHYRALALRPGAATAMVNYYRANLAGLARPAPTPIIDTPVLMIWGEQDTALGVELTEGYARYVANFTLHRLPGVSHWVQQEAPEQVNALMQSWIAAHLAKP